MSIENSINNIIEQKLKEGIIEKLIAQELEKGITNALGHLFGSYGEVTKILEEKIKSVMIPYLEKYDYSEYVVKLDHVLVEILRNSSTDNKTIINNFKHLLDNEELSKIALSDIFNKWTEYVKEHVNIDNLDIIDEEDPRYEDVYVALEYETEEKRSWSSCEYSKILFECEYAKILFECEQDEKLNIELRMHKWNNYNYWTLDYNTVHNIGSLRHLDEFEIFLMKLSQNNSEIRIDIEETYKYVTPNAAPEEY